MTLKNRKIQAILIISVLGLAFLIWGSVSAAIGNYAKTQVPIDPDADMLHLLQTEMANPSISIDVKNADRPRLEEILMVETQRAGAISKQQLGLQANSTPFPMPSGPFGTWKASDGINNNPPIPMHTSDAVLKNSWVKTIGNDTFLVYAGVLADDPSQGLVYVKSPNAVSFHKILSPVKTGALKIISYTNLVLTLQSEKGDLIYFDAQKEQFSQNTNMPDSPATAYP